MKTFLLALVLLPLSAAAGASGFSECRVAGDTVLSLYPILPPSLSSVPDGALAVTGRGEKIGKKEILADAPMHFQRADGSISAGYQWLYTPVHAAPNQDDLYLATPPGGELISIAMVPETPGQTKVTYVGEQHGLYLTLLCR